LTFKQAQDKGGIIKKGEKGTSVVFWKISEHADEESGELKKAPLLRYYTVFNLSQVEGIEAPADSEFTNDNDPIEEAEKIVAGMPCRPDIKHGSTRAFYSPKDDFVSMPEMARFAGSEAYYSTLFHELSHSTMHEKRLARRDRETPAPYGSEEYSKEELIAEFSSAFLCAQTGISPAVIANQAAYIQGWSQALKSNPKWIVCAASAGQKASEYILNSAGGTE